MLQTLSPVGTNLSVPETPEEDNSYFTPDKLPDAVEFYHDQGYVVLRGLIPLALCARVRDSFNRTVRPSRLPILRQKNMCYERNTFTTDGFLGNPIFNVQDLGSGSLSNFRQRVLDVLTYPAAATAALLSTDRTKLIQSMFFEAPAGTWAHQDSYYQDSASGLGGAVAGWFALEDIDARAGRFYVCPGSHLKMVPLLNNGEYNVADGHIAYQQAILSRIQESGLTIKAPYLAAGDVLFWNSLTVHGSLPASAPGVSRTSLTAHYLREADAMLQFHNRIREQATSVHNNMTVCLLHDQDLLRNRFRREAAFRFPQLYRSARRLALRMLLAKQSMQPKAAPVIQAGHPPVRA